MRWKSGKNGSGRRKGKWEKRKEERKYSIILHQLIHEFGAPDFYVFYVWSWEEDKKRNLGNQDGAHGCHGHCHHSLLGLYIKNQFTFKIIIDNSADQNHSKVFKNKSLNLYIGEWMSNAVQKFSLPSFGVGILVLSHTVLQIPSVELLSSWDF